MEMHLMQKNKFIDFF